MNKLHIEVLEENLHTVNLSLKRLIYSYEVCKKIGIKDIYSEEEFMVFEAMTSRYARSTDMMINKLFRSLDAVEYVDGKTVIDIANNIEKRGIADSNDLYKIKDLRNSIAHEYVTENIVRFFAEVLELTPLLKTVIDNLNNYCSRYVIVNEPE
jgi:hypothetical protein